MTSLRHPIFKKRVEVFCIPAHLFSKIFIKMFLKKTSARNSIVYAYLTGPIKKFYKQQHQPFRKYYYAAHDKTGVYQHRQRFSKKKNTPVCPGAS